jgi:hypothetical protein
MQGESDRLSIPAIRPGYAEFAAVYPYEPGKPTVETRARTVARGSRVNFSIAMTGVPRGEDGIFSFDTRLYDPEGKWVDVIPWSVQGGGGRAETHVRFALNDPVGTWRLTVREITTGRVAACDVVVE